MPQRLFVDRGALVAYLALSLAGCSGAPGAVVPAGTTPVSREQVSQWVTATLPPEHRLHRFKWLFQDERSSAGGRGSARIAPPDSLRFDIAGPFGSNPAAAAVVGDSALWVEPEDVIKKLVPNYPLMWALLGVARLPDSGAALRGVSEGNTTTWQYALGADTVEYVRSSGSPGKLLAEVRQGQNRWPEAMAHWEQVARLRALEPTGLLKLAAAQIHERRWDDARESLRRLESRNWPQRFGDVRHQVRDLEEKLKQK